MATVDILHRLMGDFDEAVDVDTDGNEPSKCLVHPFTSTIHLFVHGIIAVEQAQATGDILDGEVASLTTLIAHINAKDYVPSESITAQVDYLNSVLTLAEVGRVSRAQVVALLLP